MNELVKNVDFKVSDDGEAYVSQRKTAELCGVQRNSVVHFFKGKSDISQGVSAKCLSSVVHFYAMQGKPEAIETLGIFAEAGAKAWIYHQAGYKFDAVPRTFVEALRMAADKAEENEKLRMMVDNTFGYSSILRAAQHVGVHESTFSWRVLKREANALGMPQKRVLKREANALGMPPKKAPSPRYAYQLLYPIQAIKNSYPQFDFDDLKPEV